MSLLAFLENDNEESSNSIFFQVKARQSSGE